MAQRDRGEVRLRDVRILVVDDDAALLDSLRIVLTAEAHDVVCIGTGKGALAHAQRERFDAILCDVNLPDLDGLQVCRQLRARDDRTPFILITSRDGDIDEALGLDLGADDYITKPFSIRVLLARLGALIRRTAPATTGTARVRAGQLEIDLERCEIRYRQQLVPASLTELRLLAALAERAGRVISRDALLARARDDDSVVASRLVDTYVARLRRKLEHIEAGAGRQLETVTGAGYRWRD